MTDAKQALEVAEDLRIGLAEMAASCSVNMETWDRFSNNVLDAASLLSSLAEENERLRGALEPFAVASRLAKIGGYPPYQFVGAGDYGNAEAALNKDPDQ